MRRLYLIFLCGILVISGNLGNAAQPKILVYARSADSRGLDPVYEEDDQSVKVMVNLYDNLVRYKPGSTEVQPALATSWVISADGKVWTFKLRRGVKFHDGTPFNAEAVKFSVERQMPPNATGDMPYSSFVFEPLKRVEVLDEYTVRFILSRPCAPFLANLAMPLAAPIVSPAAVKKYGPDFLQHPVGTGPFKFEKWEKDQQIVLVKNPNYWGQKANADKIMFKVIRENSARVGELLSGMIDMMDGLDPADAKKLESAGMRIVKSPGMNLSYLGFACQHKPFTDVRLRQAIAMAINREGLAKSLYQGNTKASGSLLPSFIPGYDSKLIFSPYNPQKAKKLLMEAGYKDFTFTMITYTNLRPYSSINGVKLAEAVQADLLKIGVKTTIKAYPWKEYNEILAKGTEGDAFFYGRVGVNGDADNYLSMFDSRLIADNINITKYVNLKVDLMRDRAAISMNPQERNSIYQEIQRILNNDVPLICISHGVNMAVCRPNIKGFELHPTGVSWLNTVSKQ